MLAKFLNKINENYKQIGKIKTSTFSFFQYNTLFKFSFFLHKKKIQFGHYQSVFRCNKKCCTFENDKPSSFK